MLKLSSGGDYGLMFLAYLASIPQGSYASLTQVAQQQHLPVKYLEHVAKSLTRAGVIKSRHGKEGGYTLAVSPTKLRLTQVLRALEEGVEPIRCTHNGRCCERRVACEFKTGYQKVHVKLYELLAGYSLADLLPTVKGIKCPKN